MANLPLLPEKYNTYGHLKSHFLSKPFYRTGTQDAHNRGVINLSRSQTTHLTAFAEKFNDAKQFSRLNAKGSFNKRIQTTFQKLQYIAAKQFEEMRQATPERYLLEISEHSNLIQIRTSRKGLANMLGVSERTVYNHIAFLQSKEVEPGLTLIARRTVASNRRVVTYDNCGRATSIKYELMYDQEGKPLRGRGDWILWLDKKAFYWNWDTAEILKISKAENQQVTNTKRQNLPTTVQQEKKDTRIQFSITRDKEGASHTISEAAPGADKGKRSTRPQKQAAPGQNLSSAAGRRDVSPVSEIFRSFDTPGAAPVSEAEKDVLRNLKAHTAMQEKEIKPEQVPGTNFRNTLIAILVILYQRLLFPHVSPTYWAHYREVIHNQFGLLMGAVQSGLIDDDKQRRPNLFSKVITLEKWFNFKQLEVIAAFTVIRRGIVKCQENMLKHPDKYPDASLRTSPVRYLDIDRQDSGFSFQKVLMMVKNETERARKRVDEQHRLFAWKVPFARKEALVTRAYTLLAGKEPDKFIRFSKETFHTLKQLADEVDMPVTQRNNLFNSFIREIQAVRTDLQERAGLDVSKEVLAFVADFRKEQFRSVA